MASIAFRRSGCTSHLHHYFICVGGICKSWIGWCLHHIRNDVHIQCLLGLSSLDRLRTRLEVSRWTVSRCALYSSFSSAVERVVEYLNLPQEPFTVIASSRPPAYWPSSTSSNSNALVSIENLSVKYAPELPTILHNVTLEIKAQERVGLLGRTGSGKSTLAMSLLRFVSLPLLLPLIAKIFPG